MTLRLGNMNLGFFANKFAPIPSVHMFILPYVNGYDPSI